MRPNTWKTFNKKSFFNKNRKFSQLFYKGSTAAIPIWKVENREDTSLSLCTEGIANPSIWIQTCAHYTCTNTPPVTAMKTESFIATRQEIQSNWLQMP